MTTIQWRMDMELTDKQIEAAAKAMCDLEASTYPQCFRWSSPELSPEVRIRSRESARAAAPFLQMSWTEPTVEEWSAIYRDDTSLSARLRVCEFVRRRNAALLPKPVDPRRETVRQALMQDGVDNQEKMITAILAALDEVKR